MCLQMSAASKKLCCTQFHVSRQLTVRQLLVVCPVTCEPVVATLVIGLLTPQAYLPELSICMTPDRCWDITVWLHSACTRG